MKYKDWIATWLNLYVKPVVKERTFDRYSQICNKNIIPLLGEYNLCELSSVILQQFIVDIGNGINKQKSLSAGTINCIITVIQKSLKMAVIIGVAEKQYADTIKRPKLTEKQIECFTYEEQKAIENYVLNSKKEKLFGIILCFYTGLRIGELLSLKWSDIDFEKGLMYITKSCHDSFVDGVCVKVIDTPKTPHSKRIVPLAKPILSRIKTLKKTSDCDYVVSENKKPVGNRSYQRTFELVLKKLGIPHKGFHATRHTFATRAIECGMDVKTLAEVLGHKNPTITLSRYVHSLLEHKVNMMNKLGKLF